MLTESRKRELSNLLRPVAAPQQLENLFTEEQKRRMLDVVHDKGEWKLILAQHFPSVESLIATFAGGFPEGVTPTLDMFLTPTFRGFFANYSAVLYPELHDVFYNETFLQHVKSYWNAEYAKPQMMLFNINGPCGNNDPRPSRFAELPRCPVRECADVAVLGDGTLGTVPGLSDQDGASHHLVQP